MLHVIGRYTITFSTAEIGKQQRIGYLILFGYWGKANYTDLLFTKREEKRWSDTFFYEMVVVLVTALYVKAQFRGGEKASPRRQRTTEETKGAETGHKII